MTYHFYKITQIDNLKSYIGQTTIGIDVRFKQHCSTKNSNRKQTAITKAIRRYGSSKFKIECLASFDNITEDQAHIIEGLLIETWKTLAPNGYNLRVSGRKTFTIGRHFRNKVSKDRFEVTNDNGHCFCSYSYYEVAKVLDISPQRLIYDIKVGKRVNGYLVKNINNPIVPVYLKGATKYLFTNPDGIQFCRYGLAGIEDEIGLQREGLIALLDVNNRRYGKKLKNYSVERVDKGNEEEIKQIVEARKLQTQQNVEDRVKLASFTNAFKNKFVLINKEGNEFCCTYGLAHCKEQFDLDPSIMLKISKGKMIQTKGWKCYKITT